jgi:hypothetical protein
MGGRVLEGKIFKLLTDLQPNGRLARVLIEVSDPLDLLKRNGDRRPLLLGDYVSVTIEGRTVDGVFVISREHLKDGRRVYIVDNESRLRMRGVDIIWNGEEQVLVRGLEPETLLIISDMPAAVEGMKLRIQGSGETMDAEDTETRGRPSTKLGAGGDAEK